MSFNWTSLVGDLSAGGISGYAVGLFAKKFFRLMSFLIGGYIASLLFLSGKGWIVVQWEAIGSSTDGVLSLIGQLSSSVGLLGIGAISGFLIGWRSG